MITSIAALCGFVFLVSIVATVIMHKRHLAHDEFKQGRSSEQFELTHIIGWVSSCIVALFICGSFAVYQYDLMEQDKQTKEQILQELRAESKRELIKELEE